MSGKAVAVGEGDIRACNGVIGTTGSAGVFPNTHAEEVDKDDGPPNNVVLDGMVSL